MENDFDSLRVATKADRGWVVELLARAFVNGQQTLYLIGDSSGIHRRLQVLYRYAFDLLQPQGTVFVTPDRNGVAMWRRKEIAKKPWLKTRLNLRFLLQMGFWRIPRILRMENQIQSQYPAGGPELYLWILGVDPEHQGKKLSSKLLDPVLAKADREGWTTYLETSTPDNVAIYERRKFETYYTLYFGTDQKTLFMMRRPPQIAS